MVKSAPEEKRPPSFLFVCLQQVWEEIFESSFSPSNMGLDKSTFVSIESKCQSPQDIWKGRNLEKCGRQPSHAFQPWKLMLDATFHKIIERNIFLPKKIKWSIIVSILVLNILVVYKIVQLSFGFFNIGYCRWSSELKVSHAMGD